MEDKKSSTRKDKNTVTVSDDAAMAIKAVLGIFDVKITKKDLVERLVVWFKAQDDVVQGTILGTIPPSQRANVARIVLEGLARPPKPSGVNVAGLTDAIQAEQERQAQGGGKSHGRKSA